MTDDELDSALLTLLDDDDFRTRLDDGSRGHGRFHDAASRLNTSQEKVALALWRIAEEREDVWIAHILIRSSHTPDSVLKELVVADFIASAGDETVTDEEYEDDPNAAAEKSERIEMASLALRDAEDRLCGGRHFNRDDEPNPWFSDPHARNKI